MSARTEFIETFTLRIQEGYELVRRGRELGQHERANALEAQVSYLGLMVAKAELATDDEWNQTHRPRRPRLAWLGRWFRGPFG